MALTSNHFLLFQVKMDSLSVSPFVAGEEKLLHQSLLESLLLEQHHLVMSNAFDSF